MNNENNNVKSVSSKIVKILAIINIVILLGMAVFCFQNSHLNIEFICDECSIYTEEIFTFSKVVVILQAIVAFLMCRQSRKDENDSKYGIVSIFAGIGTALAVIQGLAFYINPGISTHGSNVTAEEMMGIQIVVGMIIGLVMVVTNIILFSSARMYIHQSNKEYIEELGDNHVLSKI